MLQGGTQTNLVFQASCAAFTLIFAVSAEKGGNGGFVVELDAMFLDFVVTVAWKRDAVILLSRKAIFMIAR